MSQLNDLWTKARELVKEEILSPVTYDTWIKTMTPLKMDGNVLYFSVPTDINKTMLENRHMSLIKNALFAIGNRKYEVILVLEADKENYTQESKKEATLEKKENDCFGKYTFDNFVVGTSNRFAHAASLAVAESPGTSYNPVFLWGGVGLGKTHLMHAIDNHIHTFFPKLKTLFVSAETFTTELINSLAKKTMEEFRNKYRQVDVLFIDDVQFIAGKVATEEEFFHTFNALYDSGKQIVLSSDRPPKEIPNLTERLRSRFEWDVMCDIQSPDYETRIAILQKKAEEHGVDIDINILMYIADAIKSNIRELEGVLKTLIAYSGFTNTKISLELAEEAVKNYRKKQEEKVITPQTIIEKTAKYYHVRPEDITSKRRTQNIVTPRFVAIYLCSTLTNLSYKKIGENFGGRDHSTISHSIDEMKASLDKDKELKEIVEVLTTDLRNDS